MFNHLTTKKSVSSELKRIENELKKFNREKLLRKGFPKFLVDQQFDYYTKAIPQLRQKLYELGGKSTKNTK